MTILSEDKFRRIEREWSGHPSTIGDIQDVPALIASHRLLAEEVARLKSMLGEWEIAADEGYGAAMLGTPITPDWLRERKREGAKMREDLSSQVARLTEALSEAKEWIDNWSPTFTNDDEWPETARKMLSALSEHREAANGREG